MRRSLLLSSLSFGALVALSLAAPAARADDGDAAPRGLRARIDTNGDGQIDDAEREAARAAFRAKMLERFDTNHDGQIDDAERAAAREAREGQGGRRGHRGHRGRRGRAMRAIGHQLMLERFDADHSGRLDATECQAVKAEALARFDQDGDGRLERGERRAMGQQLRERMRQKLDTNGDGQIDQAERDAARTAFRAKPDSTSPWPPKSWQFSASRNRWTICRRVWRA